ncbi:MAG: thiamine pyrophosphate-binding protein [Rhodospirillales bacterium]|nr:thiamine pyrophosphate-binding protein [Rhodospirillales bacterium]
MRGADVIAKKLADAGCCWAFGIPGGEVLAMMDALSDAGLTFILTKHENSAGFMAEGSWHASGAPGVLLATVGPGVANAVNVIANAQQDRVPLIFLTGRIDLADQESYTHQVFDQQVLLRPIVKASFCVSAETLGLVMEKALTIACSGQPGPVHIDIPISVAERPAPASAFGHVPPLRVAQAPAAGPVLEAARALLAKAQRPLAVAGVDAVNEGAGPAIGAFCRTQGIPLITSYKGKGLLDENNLLALGGAGLSPKADKILMPLFAEADLVLLLGYDPIEMRIGWRDPWPASTPVVEIAPVERTHGMHRVSHLLLASLPESLRALAEGIEPAPRWPDGAAAAARTALAEAFRPQSGGFGPAEVFQTLRDSLPPETLATADSGAHRILLSQVWRCPEPRSLLQSTALCTMGCALPLAMGHALVQPERPTVVFVGDAGLEMVLGELATLRDLSLPIVVCVLVDESLALIELKQRASQRKNLGVDFAGTDFPAVAAALGGHGLWIDDEASLAREAEAALGRRSFTLLACRIGRRAYDGTF